MSMQQPGSTSSSPNPGAIIPALALYEAYASVQPELEAIALDATIPINIDIESAVITVLGCTPELRALEAEVAALPRFDLAKYQRLQTYAYALSHAHTQYQVASRPIVPIPELTEELRVKRDLFVADVTALAKRKLIDGAPLELLQGGVSPRQVAYDVLRLAAMLRNNWASVSARTAVSIDELNDAERKATALTVAIGLKEQGDPVATETHKARARAFTLLVDAYDQARRAIGYLRWDEGDADKIAPSLYGGRTRRSSGSETAEPTGAAKPEAGGAIAPVAGGVAAPVVTGPTVISPNGGAQPVSPGLPNGSPFTNG